MRRFGLALMVLCAGAAGCDFSFGDSSTGESGELEFSYAGDALFDCLFGCDVETPMAVGATSTIFIDGDHPPQSRFTVRVPPTVSATYTETFECDTNHQDGSLDIRPVAPGEACQAGEELEVSRQVDLVPSAEGTFLLEVLEGGDVLDWIELTAHQARSVTVRSENDDRALQTISLQSGETLAIGADLLDVNGHPLYLDDVEFSWTIDDQDVASVERSWGDAIFGAATTAELSATSSGSTVLRFEGAGVSGQIPIVVQ